MDYYFGVLKKYAVFRGRSQRKEYWMFCLFSTIISFAIGFIDVSLGTFDFETGYGLLGGIYTVAILLPGVAVSVRRLHDTDRNGWWLFIVLIPIFGAITVFVFMVLDSTTGKNQYGDNPKKGIT